MNGMLALVSTTHRQIIQLDQWRLFVCEHTLTTLVRCWLKITRYVSYMGKRGPQTDRRRGYVVAMARSGDLASLEEGAVIAGATKATVRRWLVAAGIDWMLTRRQWLGRRQRRCEDWVISRAPPRKPSKPQMRRQIASAIRRTRRAAELEEQGQANTGCSSPPQ